MWRARALVVALAVGGGAVVACTTFDGLTASPSRLDAGDASTDGAFDGAPPDAAPDAGPSYPTFLSLADAASVCRWAQACPHFAKSMIYSAAIPLDTTNFSLCMDWLAGPVSPTHVGIQVQSTTLKCASKGTSCAAASDCLSQEFIDTTDARCAGIPQDAGPEAGEGSYQRCDQATNSVIRCNPNFTPDVLHCASAYYAPGTTCLVGSDGTKSCAQAVDCPVTSCSGDILEFCTLGGLRIEENCASEGYTCGVDRTTDAGGADPQCLSGDRVRTCTPDGTSCAGSVIQVCDGFNVAEFDCAALGGTCTNLGGTARCKLPNEECGPEDNGINQCAGSKITLCIGGKRTTFDCADAGLQCVAGTAAVSGHCG